MAFLCCLVFTVYCRLFCELCTASSSPGHCFKVSRLSTLPEVLIESCTLRSTLPRYMIVICYHGSKAHSKTKLGVLVHPWKDGTCLGEARGL